MNKCYNVGNLNIPAHPETTYLTIIDKDFNVNQFKLKEKTEVAKDIVSAIIKYKYKS